MKMPLMAYASPRNVTIVYQKKIEYVDPPFDPYFIAYKDGMQTDQERIWGVDFHTRKKVHACKIPITDVQAARDQMSELRSKGYGIEYNRPIEQIFMDEPDFFRGFPNGEPDVLCFDIEVYTDGSGIFPHYDRSPIISIGVKYNDEPAIVFMNYKPSLDHPDKWILVDFLRFLKEKDPDIVVTYNGTRFDLPFIYERAVAAGLDVTKYSRLRKKDWKFRGAYSIPGCIHYDLFYADVVKDQSMMGIKNRRLKTVAEWFGIKAIELDPEESANTSQLIGSERLREYNISDVDISRSLYNIYHMNHMMMAEFLGVPLDLSINKYPSFAPKIVLGRKLKSQGFIFLDNNEIRHHEITDKYEGAIVDIYKTGLIKKVWKLDVGSFYPSTMIAFNISPEICKIVKTEEFTGQWNYKMIDGIFWIRIPDKNLNKDIILSIDQTKPGVLSTMLKDMKEERFQLKKKARQAKTSKEEGIYEAQSSALKVLMNAVYGSAALPETVYSDLSVALATIAICRLIFSKVLEKYKDSIIEADSVSGDTPIWIRKNGSKINIIPIRDLFDDKSELTENESISRYIPEGVETWTRHGWSSIKQVYRHRVYKKTVFVHTEGGAVQCTEDHSLFTEEGIEISPRDLDIGSPIEVIKKIPKDSLPSVSGPYAKALGYMCAEGCKVDTKDGVHYVETDMDPKILKAIYASHPEGGNSINPVKQSVVQNPIFVKRFENSCTCSYGPKVPGFILMATDKIITNFLSGYTLANRRLNRSSLYCKTIIVAAGISNLLRKLGKNTKVLWSDKEIGWIVQTTSKEIGNSVVEKVDGSPYEKDVYDISTEDNTFVSALGNICLHNTDGIYVDKPLDSQEIQEYVKEIVIEMIGKCDHPITIERDTYGPGWFHRAKNYVLMDVKSGEPIFHGVAFKSSSHPRLYDNVLKKVAMMVLQGENVDTIWDQTRDLVDLSKKELKDFTMRTTIRSDPESYANDNSLQSVLIAQAKKLGIEVEVGTQIEYIVTKGRSYTIASNVKDVSQVDYEYYTSELDKAMELFGIKQIQQHTLL